MQRKMWLAGFLALLLLFSGCGVAQEEYDAVMGERDAARKEAQSTKDELETARNTAAALTSNLTKFKDDLAAMIKERDEKQAKSMQFESSLNETLINLANARKDISGLELNVTALKARIPVLEYETYTNNETGFSIQYPKKWSIIINVFKDKEGLVTFADMNTGANIAVTVERLPAAMTAGEYLDAAKEQLPQGYVCWGSKEITINRVKAERGVFTYLDGEAAQVITSLVNANTAYSIILSHGVNDFFDYAHTFNEVQQSFKIFNTGI